MYAGLSRLSPPLPHLQSCVFGRTVSPISLYRKILSGRRSQTNQADWTGPLFCLLGYDQNQRYLCGVQIHICAAFNARFCISIAISVNRTTVGIESTKVVPEFRPVAALSLPECQQLRKSNCKGRNHHCTIFILSPSANGRGYLVGMKGFEPLILSAAGLKSDVYSNSTTCPYIFIQ